MGRNRVLLAAFAVAIVAVPAVASTGGASPRTSRATGASAMPAHHHGGAGGWGNAGRSGRTLTPIKHVVVIYQENVSFDHYFGTYPNAAGTDGQPFAPAPGTPAVNGLRPATSPSLPAHLQHTADLTTTNPNSALPLRLDSTPTGAPGSPGGLLTCDQDHIYTDEQQAFNGGLMDQFVQSVGTAHGTSPFGTPCDPRTVMDYYDGNSLTALWNYAQRYAMSDNSYGSTFGPSTPGAINLASGNTGGVDMTHQVNGPTIATATAPNADLTPDGLGGYSLISDAQPYWDDCSTRDAIAFGGTTIGDELNHKGLSWGWFEGGFRPTKSFADALAATGATGQPTSTFIPNQFKNAGFESAVPHSSNQGICDAVHPVGAGIGGTGQWGYKDDYIPHHEPFQYYASTANPHHLTLATNASGEVPVTGPASLATVGRDTQSFAGRYGVVPQFDTPNHNYDTSDFDQLVAAITAGRLPASALPAVTFLKAPGYQDGHGAYSDPGDEQQFVVREVNALMQSPTWSSTAIFVNYDDSDGWYDHAYSGVINPSFSPADNLTGATLGPISATNPTSQKCGANPQAAAPLGNQQGRCGFGPRLPMMLISPYARANGVDHHLSDEASIINFIEYNWRLPGIPGSFDQVLAGVNRAVGIPFDLAGLFDFGAHRPVPAVLLNPVTGQVDLANAHLEGADLRGVNLSGADLTNAQLQRANLSRAFLANANLLGANLQGTSLRWADLTHARLHGDFLRNASLFAANLTGADLSGTSLRGADLRNADLTNADLTGADLTGALTRHVTWSNTTCPDGTSSDAHGGTCVAPTPRHHRHHHHRRR